MRTFVPQAAVEAFHERILLRLARRDIVPFSDFTYVATWSGFEVSAPPGVVLGDASVVSNMTRPPKQCV